MLNDLQEIERFKEEKNAIILAHNYQAGDIQEVADFMGDSLELYIKASEIEDKDLVVFCGVDFMAEQLQYSIQIKKQNPCVYMLAAEEIRKFKR